MDNNTEKKKESPEQKTEPVKTKEDKKPEPTPPKEEKLKPVKKEEKSVCAKCGKRLKRKNWYYRNGKYYCNKRCWKQTKQNLEKEGSDA